ncbi:MAG TPA: hypothetical protein VG713_20575, partial [Pirellulales bacterium]|nr:hypothetical protein [Pirellulales bacterium]
MNFHGPDIDFGLEFAHLNRGAVVGLIAIASIVVALAGLLIVAQFVDVIPGLSTGAIRRTIDASGPWGPVLFLAVLAGSIVFAPVPNTPFFIAAGLVWGSWFGSLLSLLGLAIGSLLAF